MPFKGLTRVLHIMQILGLKPLKKKGFSRSLEHALKNYSRSSLHWA